MLKLYVLVTQLSKQQRFPGDIYKSRTDKSFLGMMEVQWSQEGVLRQGWESFCQVRVWCILTDYLWRGNGNEPPPRLQHWVWNFEWSIHNWQVFAKTESWMPVRERLSSLPPPCPALRPHSLRFVCLFSCHEVLFILFLSYLFPIFFSITPANLILETFRHGMCVRNISKIGN